MLIKTILSKHLFQYQSNFVFLLSFKDSIFFSMFTYNDHSVRMVTCCSSFKRKQSVTPLMIGTDRKKTMRMCVCVLFVFNTIVTLSSLYSVRNCVDRTQKECCCAGAINPSIKSVSFPSLTLAYMHTHTHTSQPTARYISLVFLSFFCCYCRRCGKKSGINK